MSISDLKKAVLRGGFSNEELEGLCSYTRGIMTQQTRATIEVGQQVYVVQKTKKTLGTVVAVKVKKALINLPKGRYNVPLSMIEVA
tara:strand:+ start:80 stop:337 length:258 start_codon:yes stop_codon:yes gene_type:complete